MKRSLLIGRLTAISALACTTQSGLTAKTTGVMNIDRNDDTGQLGNSGGSGHQSSASASVSDPAVAIVNTVDLANAEQPAARRRC